jgi:hypothetical protein
VSKQDIHISQPQTSLFLQTCPIHHSLITAAAQGRTFASVPSATSSISENFRHVLFPLINGDWLTSLWVLRCAPDWFSGRLAIMDLRWLIPKAFDNHICGEKRKFEGGRGRRHLKNSSDSITASAIKCRRRQLGTRSGNVLAGPKKTTSFLISRLI